MYHMRSSLLAVLAAFAMLGRTLADTIADDIRNNNHRASTSDDAPHWVSAPKHLIHGEKEDVSAQLELVPRDATGSSSLHGGPAPANQGFDGHAAGVPTYIGEIRRYETSGSHRQTNIHMCLRLLLVRSVIV